MRVELIALSLALACMTAALPTEDTYQFISKRAVSPDNTCGNVYAGTNKNYSCDAMVNTGGCCSQYGKWISLSLKSLCLPSDLPPDIAFCWTILTRA
jgi:hypothetical protein